MVTPALRAGRIEKTRCETVTTKGRKEEPRVEASCLFEAFLRGETKRERLPLGPHSVVGRNVDGIGGRVVAYGQTQVGDAAGAVLLHQDVLRLQVSVGDSRFPWRRGQKKVLSEKKIS